MKRVLFSLLILAAPLAYSQTPTPTPSQQELMETVNILKGRVDDLTDARNTQEKKLRDLQARVDELAAQIAKPSGNYATQDDVKALQAAIAAEDKKRQADNDDIIKTLKDMAKISGGGKTPATPPSPQTSNHQDQVASIATTPVPSAHGPGFTYVAKSGDTLVKISRNLFKEQHVKVSVEEILKANPFLKGDAKNLKEDDKLFIPDPKGTDSVDTSK